MRRILLLVTLSIFFATANGQAIFAHNDYLKSSPFLKAFELKVAYIEADIFLEKGSLVVAHTKAEIDPSKTLESMYLRPLLEKIKANVASNSLTLMIDLKTGGKPTMTALVDLLEKFPDITSHPGLYITLSGNYPPPSEWSNYPRYITFDGRPNTDYTTDEIARIRLVSTSFASVSTWNGKDEIPSHDLEKIKETIEGAHKLGKPMRFWASPDFPNAWEKFIDAGVDVLNSDKIEELSTFLKSRK